jgi:hypothetical protein
MDLMFSEILNNSVAAMMKLTEYVICDGSPKVILAPWNIMIPQK